MSTKIEIVASENKLGGEPRLANTRVGVSHIIQYYEKGWIIDKISRELDLEPLQVLKALKYYYKNTEEIRNLIKQKTEENSQKNKQV